MMRFDSSNNYNMIFFFYLYLQVTFLKIPVFGSIFIKFEEQSEFESKDSINLQKIYLLNILVHNIVKLCSSTFFAIVIYLPPLPIIISLYIYIFYFAIFNYLI
jgi:hypothetical protein